MKEVTPSASGRVRTKNDVPCEPTGQRSENSAATEHAPIQERLQKYLEEGLIDGAEAFALGVAAVGHPDWVQETLDDFRDLNVGQSHTQDPVYRGVSGVAAHGYLAKEMDDLGARLSQDLKDDKGLPWLLRDPEGTVISLLHFFLLASVRHFRWCEPAGDIKAAQILKTRGFSPVDGGSRFLARFDKRENGLLNCPAVPIPLPSLDRFNFQEPLRNPESLLARVIEEGFAVIARGSVVSIGPIVDRLVVCSSGGDTIAFRQLLELFQDRTADYETLDLRNFSEASELNNFLQGRAKAREKGALSPARVSLPRIWASSVDIFPASYAMFQGDTLSLNGPIASWSLDQVISLLRRVNLDSFGGVGHLSDFVKRRSDSISPLRESSIVKLGALGAMYFALRNGIPPEHSELGGAGRATFTLPKEADIKGLEEFLQGEKESRRGLDGIWALPLRALPTEQYTSLKAVYVLDCILKEQFRGIPEALDFAVIEKSLYRLPSGELVSGLEVLDDYMQQCFESLCEKPGFQAIASGVIANMNGASASLRVRGFHLPGALEHFRASRCAPLHLSAPTVQWRDLISQGTAADFEVVMRALFVQHYQEGNQPFIYQRFREQLFSDSIGDEVSGEALLTHYIASSTASSREEPRSLFHHIKCDVLGLLDDEGGIRGSRGLIPEGRLIPILGDYRESMSRQAKLGIVEAALLELVHHELQGDVDSFDLSDARLPSNVRSRYSGDVKLRSIFTMYRALIARGQEAKGSKAHDTDRTPIASISEAVARLRGSYIAQRFAALSDNPELSHLLEYIEGTRPADRTQPVEVRVFRVADEQYVIPLGLLGGEPVGIQVEGVELGAVATVAPRTYQGWHGEPEELVEVLTGAGFRRLFVKERDGVFLRPFHVERFVRMELSHVLSELGPEVLSEIEVLRRMHGRNVHDLVWGMIGGRVADLVDRKQFEEALNAALVDQLAHGDATGPGLEVVPLPVTNQLTVAPEEGTNTEDESVDIPVFEPGNERTSSHRAVSAREDEAPHPEGEPRPRERQPVMAGLPERVAALSVAMEERLRAAERARDVIISSLAVEQIAMRIEGSLQAATISSGLRRLIEDQTKVFIQRLERDRLLGLSAEEGLRDPIECALAVLAEERSTCRSALRNDALDALANEVERCREIQSVCHERGLSRGCILSLYQLLFIQRAMETRRVLLGDEMGLGKTIQVLSLALYAGSGSVLIVAPKPERWAEELAKWVNRPCRVTFVGSQSPSDAIQSQFAAKPAMTLSWKPQREERVAQLGDFFSQQASADEPHFMIVTPDSLRSLAGDIPGPKRCDFMAIDEAHLAKNPASGISQAVMGLGAEGIQAAFRIAATGTPLENTPSDLFTYFKFLAEGESSPETRFIQSLSRAKFEAIFIGNDASGLSLLNSFLELVMVRRKAQLVVTGLPKVRDIRARVDLEKGEYRLVGHESGEVLATRKLPGNYRVQLDLYELVRRRPTVFRRRYVAGFEEVDVETEQETSFVGREGLDRYIRLEQVTLSPEIFGIAAPSAKFDAAVEIALEYVERGMSVAVFSDSKKAATLFRDQLDAALTARGFDNQVAYVDGAVIDRPGNPARSDAVQDFQSGQKRVIVATAETMGVSIELTQGSLQIHLNHQWTAARRGQIVGRNVRRDPLRNYPGRVVDVVHIELESPHSIDDAKNRLVEVKGSLMDMVIDGTLSPRLLATFRSLDKGLRSLMNEDVERGLRASEYEGSLAQHFRFLVGRIVQSQLRQSNRELIARQWDEVSELYSLIIEQKATFFLNVALLDHLFRSGALGRIASGGTIAALDVGAGPSTLYRAYRRIEDGLAAKGLEFDITDFDISPEMLRRGVSEGRRQIAGEFSDLESLVGDARFGMINLSFALQYVAQPARFFAQANRLLNTGGFITICLPANYRVPGRFLGGLQELGFAATTIEGDKLRSFLPEDEAERLERHYGAEYATELSRKIGVTCTLIVAKKVEECGAAETPDSAFLLHRELRPVGRGTLRRLALGGGSSRLLDDSVKVAVEGRVVHVRDIVERDDTDLERSIHALRAMIDDLGYNARVLEKHFSRLAKKDGNEGPARRRKTGDLESRLARKLLEIDSMGHAAVLLMRQTGAGSEGLRRAAASLRQMQELITSLPLSPDIQQRCTNLSFLDESLDEGE